MVIKSIENKDLDKILTFLSKEANVESEEYKNMFDYWWFDNPAHKEEHKKGYILYNEKLDEIRGFIGLYPAYFIFNHKKITIFNMTNWRVDTKYRQYSLPLLLKSLKHDNDTLLFNTTPTKKVSKILEKLQFSKFPDLNNKNYYLVTNFFNIIKKNVTWIPLINYAESLFKFFDYCYFNLAIKHNYLRKNNKTRLITEINDDFERLWYENSKTYNNMSDRSAISLKWYYFHEAIKKRFFLFGFYLNNKLVGFISFNKQGKNLVCIDCFCNKKNVDIVSSSIKHIYEFSRMNNFDVVIYPKFVEKFDKKIQNLKLLYKYKNPEDDRRYYLICKSNYKFYKENSLFTFSSGDYGL
tara:strand:+ start:55 stop:1113 length:1059 start_codon:yes stop_codon:yes gene_type:complete